MDTPPELMIPIKNLVSYTDILLPQIQTITAVVQRDEGGWILSKNSQDNDGGWTYGGMTAKKFHEYFPKVTLVDMKNWIPDPKVSQVIREKIVCIYYQDFLIPVMKQLQSLYAPAPCYLSCAINCGMGGLEHILEETPEAEHSVSKFMSAWKDYYFHLLAANPEHSSEFIHGWINRVWKYMTPVSLIT